MSNATPRPWKVREDPTLHSGVGWIENNDGQTIACCYTGKSDAELIVHAINTLDQACDEDEQETQP